MTTAVADTAEYVGKKVVITKRAADGTAVEVIGTCEAYNDAALLLKPKGKTQFELIEAADIEQVVLAPEGDKKIKAKKIKPAPLGSAKSHLLERHGLTLTYVNGLTEEQAYEVHESLDHVALDLGHIHVADKPAETITDSSDDVVSE